MTEGKTKPCYSCGENRVSEFYKDTSKKTGTSSQCKPCKKVSEKRRQAGKTPEQKVKDNKAGRARYHALTPEKKSRLKARHKKRLDSRTPEEKAAFKESQNDRFATMTTEQRLKMNAQRDKRHQERLSDPAYVAGLRLRWAVKRAKKFGHTKNPRVSSTVEGKKFDEKWVGEPCQWCGTHEDLSIDHIIPVSKGGGHTLDNLQPLCRSCNSSKGRKTVFGGN